MINIIYKNVLLQFSFHLFIKVELKQNLAFIVKDKEI